MDHVHRQGTGGGQIVATITKIGCKQQFQAGYGVADLLIIGLQGGAQFRLQVEAENGFVELHPLRTLGVQATQDFDVNGDQLLPQRKAVKPTRVPRLAELEKRQRSDQHRHGADSQRQRFGEFVEGLR